ncbi:MAG: sigma 54-interacting transcriptional regulator [Sarcina sp.]
MSNKIKIEECLKTLTTEAFKNENIDGVETIEIANTLNLRRNVVSHYLNILVTEDKVIKTKTRPVYFIHKEALNRYQNEQRKIEKIKNKDAFNELVGYSGSLKVAVEQCKSAVFYPGDMPVLFTGKSGVGKSYIASLVHKYAIESKTIEKTAPFVTLNCADYADNPELLGANLFGYKKGAFTGADKDNKGLLDAANGGYLFLDEVHRLSPEGQEKLFVFMDKGVYKRIGESNIERCAKVKCLFATTEEPKEVLLGTFMRRIPLIIDIPALNDRGLDERITIIYKFFLEEAKSMNKNLKVHKSVINYILSQEKMGNVGSVKNLVKLFCAYVYKKNIDSDLISLSLKELLHLMSNNDVEIKEYYNQEHLMIYKNEETINLQSEENELNNWQTQKSFKEIIALIEEFDNNKLSINEFRKKINTIINMYLNKIVYASDRNSNMDIIENLYRDNINSSLKIIEELYGFKYYGNTSKMLAKVLFAFSKSQYNNDDKIYKIYDIILKKFSKESIIAKKILNNLSNSMDVEVTFTMKVFVPLYIFTLMDTSVSNINAIIVAHGYSTASSIASVANQLYGEFIFDAFDMPIEMSPSEVKKNIKKYIELMDSKKDLIILVDMGSLLSIDETLTGVVEGEIGIINNITTNIALDIAGKIINNENIENMLEFIKGNSIVECKFIKARKKKKAILTTCISGIGTSVKIKNLLKKCIGDTEIEIIPYEYGRLASKGSEDEIFENYDVKLIISTTNLEIESVNIVLLEHLISSRDDEKLYSVLRGMLDEKRIVEIKQDLVKMFSLQNIINQLTILNPDKIINEVETVISNMENQLDIVFESDLKMILYIHISIMIERLVLKQGLVSEETEEIYIKSNNNFKKMIEKAFSVTLKEYNLTLTVKEIEIIQGIIESRLGKLKI